MTTIDIFANQSYTNIQLKGLATCDKRKKQGKIRDKRKRSPPLMLLWN